MAKIQDNTTTNQLTIDVTSKAARVTNYRVDGTIPSPVYAGLYVASFSIIPTTFTATTTIYLAMTNTDTAKSVYINRIALNFSFIGTNAASVSLYEFVRYNSAVPTTGTSITIIKNDNTYGTSVITDIRFSNSGLTTTGIALDYQQTATPIHVTGHMNNLVMDRSEIIEFGGPDGDQGKLVLPPSWGLLMRANNTIVSGSAIAGSIWWGEK